MNNLKKHSPDKMNFHDYLLKFVRVDVHDTTVTFLMEDFDEEMIPNSFELTLSGVQKVIFDFGMLVSEVHEKEIKEISHLIKIISSAGGEKFLQSDLMADILELETITPSPLIEKLQEKGGNVYHFRLTANNNYSWHTMDILCDGAKLKALR